MMIETGDMSYDPFALQIAPMKESREGVTIIPYTKMERVGKVVEMIQRDRRMSPAKIEYNAWNMKNALDKYFPLTIGELVNDSLRLMKISKGKFAYEGKLTVTGDNVTESCRKCIDDEIRGYWFRCGRNIEIVPDVVDHTIKLEEKYLESKQNLSAVLKGDKGGYLLEVVKNTAELLILSESWKAIANKEVEASIAKSHGKSGRYWRMVNTNGAYQREKERKIISKCVRLRRQGLGDLADELKENSRFIVVKQEDCI